MTSSTPYKIETGRLLIRCFEPQDAYALNKVVQLNRNHLLPWMPWAKEECDSLAQKVHHIREFRGQFDLDLDHLYGIFDRHNGELMGSIGLHKRPDGNAREIGFWISSKHNNKGFATEAVSSVTFVGFEIAMLDRIEIHCSVHNVRSMAVCKKNHYYLETVLQNKIEFPDGILSDKMIWVLFKKDYLKIKHLFTPVVASDMLGIELSVETTFR